MDIANKNLVVYPNKAKLKALLWQQVAFVIMSILLIIGGILLDLALWVYIVAGIGLLYFGANLCYVARRYKVIKPVVEIGPAGIVDNASGVGAGLIRWEEIQAIYPFTFMGQQSLGIVPHDERAILSRHGSLKRAIMRINKRLVGTPISIPQVALPLPIIELAQQISQYYNIPLRSKA